MTSRERLERTFRRQQVDRIPVAPFLYYNNVYEMFGYEPSIDAFFDPPDFDPMRKFLDYCARFGFDALHTLGSVWDAYTMDKPGRIGTFISRGKVPPRASAGPSTSKPRAASCGKWRTSVAIRGS